MKTPKLLFLLIIIFVLLGCTGQQTQTVQPTTISPTSIPSMPTTPFLDFDHPRLHEIAGNKPLVIDEIVRTLIQNTAYVAVIVETRDPMLNHEMLLFRVKDNISTLIYDLSPHVYMTFNIERENHPFWLLDEIPPMGIPVLISNGGNCYDCGEIVLLGITEDGQAKDITPITDFVPKGFVYITGSGRAGRIELVATQYYEFKYGADHSGSPFAFRLYGWDGAAYVDVSKDEREFYDQKIVELTTRVKETYSQPLNTGIVMPILADIFFDYESSGRVDYGWEQIKSLGDLSHWDIKNTPSEEIKIYHEVFDLLEQRKNNDKITTTP